jgi:predicted aspartyl protease
MEIRVRRFLPALVLPLLLLASGAPGFADPIPDQAAIREKILAAEGPTSATFRETDETVKSNGTRSVEHDFTRGKDFRYVFDAGPFHDEHGVFHGEAWYMNDNGQVVIDEPDPGQAVEEKLTTTVAAVHTPVEGFSIATLNARGHGVKEYVDGTSWHVTRRERLTPNGTIVTTYDDIREDHGRTFAHHLHVDNGYAKTTSDLRIMEYLPGDVAESDVAIPNPRRALVTFPAAGKPVELPVKFDNSHVYVRVNVGSRGLDLVLDSGAGGITIDSDVARQLGLPEYQKQSTVTAGRYVTYRTIVPEMHIGDLVLRDVAVQVVPQGWESSIGVKAVGLLGFDFLAELGVTIDYERQRVTVVPGATYAAPTDKNTIPVDVRIGGGQPYASVWINEALGERWVIDTGGAGTFMIFDYFARRYPKAVRDAGGGGELRSRSFIGIGGDIAVKPYQISSLKFARINFIDFVGYRVTDSSAYAESTDGIIGTAFLQMFTLGFDYGNSRVYLVPNAIGRKAMGLK